jgi:hypothetical protein
MRVGSTDDCRCKYISISRGSKLVMFQYVIDDSDLERVAVINDLGVLVDSRMTFFDHIGSIVSKSGRMLGFIKRISSSMTLTRTMASRVFHKKSKC